MGLLIDGVWHDQWYDTKSTGGRFVRQESAFRNWITPDGAPGPTGVGGYKAEPGRYHLYVSLACPWAHRTLIFRKLKGLEYAQAHRVFRLAPLHHHFEKGGWDESQVVVRFWILGILCAFFALSTLKLR